MKRENQKLKQEISKLQKLNMSISVQKEELKSIINLLKDKEKECLTLQDIIMQKENEIKNYQNILLKERQNYQLDLRKTEASFENELLQVKREQDNVKHKVDNFNKMNNLNDILYSKVLDLEKNLEQLKKEEETKIHNKEIEYNNKIDKYKKRLLDFLKGRERQKDEDDQLILNNKLNILHIQELIDEIEFQNHEVSSLLKEKKNLKIKILNLSNDLNIYKIMVLTLTKKNDEYQKKLKSIKKLKNDKFFQNFNSQKIISVTENNKNNKNIKNDFLDKRFKLYSSLQRKSNNIFNFDLNINNSKKKDFIKKNNYTIDNTISPMK
jgi:hypothetical protein